MEFILFPENILQLTRYFQQVLTLYTGTCLLELASKCERRVNYLLYFTFLWECLYVYF